MLPNTTQHNAMLLTLVPYAMVTDTTQPYAPLLCTKYYIRYTTQRNISSCNITLTYYLGHNLEQKPRLHHLNDLSPLITNTMQSYSDDYFK